MSFAIVPECVRRFFCPSSLPLLALIFAAGVADAAPPDRAPSVVFEERALVISNLSPRAPVVLFAITRVPTGYSSRTVEMTQVHSSDAAGVVRISLEKPFGPRTIVAAIDYETGAYAVVAPPDAPLRLTVLPRSLLSRKNDDELEQLAVGMDWVEAICVRPRRGVWRATVLDGGARDRDKVADGGLLFDATQMRRVHGDGDSPGRFRPRDVLVVIDPRRLEVLATEVHQ